MLSYSFYAGAVFSFNLITRPNTLTKSDFDLCVHDSYGLMLNTVLLIFPSVFPVCLFVALANCQNLSEVFWTFLSRA